MSCSNKPFILDGTHYKKRAYDKEILVDSIKIVEVIDNRIKKDSIIGFRLNEYQPVILNRSLTNYVQMMLNSIISADSSQANYIPVKVQIDEFYSYSWDNANDYKFNFVFEYPKDSVVKRYRIIDSNVVEGDEFRDQNGAINFGFRNMATLFKLKYLSDISEDSLSISYFRQDSVYNVKFGDSINFANTISIKLDDKLVLTAPFILDGTNYKKRAYDKEILVDSIKIVEVIDNRLKKDSIIGFRLNEYQPVILNRPLTNYVQMMLNSIISADSSQVNYIPVKVYIDEFYSYSWDVKNDYKFNFVFEYPKDSVLKRYRIIDSNVVVGDEFKDQKGAINFGFRNMATLFKLKYLSDKSEDSLSITYYFRQDSVYNEKYGDSINFTNTIPIKLDTKLGLSANYFYGLKSDKNFSISLVNFIRVPNSNWEFNFGIGYQQNEVYNQNDNGVISTLNYFRVNRYYFLKDLNGPFLNYTIGFFVGNERHWGNKDNYILGVRLDETIGFNLFDFFSIEAGGYQQFLGFSQILPLDAGIILSVSLTTGY